MNLTEQRNMRMAIQDLLIENIIKAGLVNPDFTKQKLLPREQCIQLDLLNDIFKEEDSEQMKKLL
jgi:hypothetical protein